MVVEARDHAEEIAGLLLDVGAGEPTRVRGEEDPVRDEGFGEGRDAKLSGLQTIEKQPIRVGAPACVLQLRELIEDEGLRLPERVEIPQAMALVVNFDEAGGKVGKVDRAAQRRGGEEGGLLLGEPPGEAPVWGARLSQVTRERTAVVDRVGREAIREQGSPVRRRQQGGFTRSDGRGMVDDVLLHAGMGVVPERQQLRIFHAPSA